MLEVAGEEQHRVCLQISTAGSFVIEKGTVENKERSRPRRILSFHWSVILWLSTARNCRTLPCLTYGNCQNWKFAHHRGPDTLLSPSRLMSGSTSTSKSKVRKQLLSKSIMNRGSGLKTGFNKSWPIYTQSHFQARVKETQIYSQVPRNGTLYANQRTASISSCHKAQTPIPPPCQAPQLTPAPTASPSSHPRTSPPPASTSTTA